MLKNTNLVVRWGHFYLTNSNTWTLNPKEARLWPTYKGVDLTFDTTAEGVARNLRKSTGLFITWEELDGLLL